MKISQSFRIYFTVKSDKEKGGKAPLYVVITINKEKCFIALKQKMVETKIWDFGKGALKGTKEETRELNGYLDEVRLKLGNCYKELQLKGKLINTTAVKNLFLDEKEEVYTLSRLVSYHNETSTTDLKWSYSVTGYFQNVRSFKTDEAKFKSIMDGTAKQRAQTAFNLCRDFAKQGGER